MSIKKSKTLLLSCGSREVLAMVLGSMKSFPRRKGEARAKFPASMRHRDLHRDKVEQKVFVKARER